MCQTSTSICMPVLMHVSIFGTYVCMFVYPQKTQWQGPLLKGSSMITPGCSLHVGIARYHPLSLIPPEHPKLCWILFAASYTPPKEEKHDRILLESHNGSQPTAPTAPLLFRGRARQALTMPCCLCTKTAASGRRVRCALRAKRRCRQCVGGICGVLAQGYF